MVLLLKWYTYFVLSIICSEGPFLLQYVTQPQEVGHLSFAIYHSTEGSKIPEITQSPFNFCQRAVASTIFNLIITSCIYIKLFKHVLNRVDSSDLFFFFLPAQKTILLWFTFARHRRVPWHGVPSMSHSHHPHPLTAGQPGMEPPSTSCIALSCTTANISNHYYCYYYYLYIQPHNVQNKNKNNIYLELISIKQITLAKS